MAEVADLLELLEADHRRVRRLLTEGETGRRLTGELSAHVVAEHQLLYPTMRKHLPEGDSAADQLTGVDRRLERALADLEDGKPAGGGGAGEISALFDQHVAAQEQVFPALRQHLDAQRLEELGQQLGPTLSEAPTHPHPNLPEEGPLEVIGDAVASSVDQLRDALGRSQER